MKNAHNANANDFELIDELLRFMTLFCALFVDLAEIYVSVMKMKRIYFLI